MAIPEGVKEKIRALSLKTVANGATAAEEATARDMIRRLSEKYNSHDEKPAHTSKQQGSNQGTTVNKQGAPSPSKGDPIKGLSLKNLVMSKIVDIDWDSVAKYHFTNGLDYYDYLNETHPWWEKRERTKRGFVRITDAENYITQEGYRIKCFEAFTKIYEERDEYR